jgi:hypothetical protein
LYGAQALERQLGAIGGYGARNTFALLSVDRDCADNPNRSRRN